jgi:2-oxoglutarate ferredoxin oxidoreductase subunit alpha
MNDGIETTAQPASPDSRVLALVGSGGDGVALLGNLLLRMGAQLGLYGVMVQSYGPQIRGGESAVVLRLSESEVQYEGDRADLVLCFRLGDLRRFQGAVRLHERSLLALEASDGGEVPDWIGSTEVSPLRYPFATLRDGIEVAGDPKNMLGLALLCRVLGWPADLAREALGKRFGTNPEALARNLAAFERAWSFEGLPQWPPLRGSGTGLISETGNEAVARAAIDAGLQFFAGYPITPSSEVMETLIRELPPGHGHVVQAEDEIAAIGMVLGASFGGVPSMTATSGPGLSLMTEMIGLSSMAELPAVIVDCQRAGPSTGMPSRTEQSDLFHAVYGGHGDFPRAVLGVYDVVHAREATEKAFHLAEEYQLPVLVLSDAYVAQRRQIRDPLPPRHAANERRRWRPEDAPARFDLQSADGVAPFRVPGTPDGTYIASGIEHTAEGYPTADTAMHQRMNEKRFRKLTAIGEETASWYRTLGEIGAPFGLVAWGSQYGLLREWIRAHPEYRAFLPEILHPFPLAAFERWRDGLEWMGAVELSYQAQFHRYLSSLTPLAGVPALARSGGVPLTGIELSRRVSREGPAAQRDGAVADLGVAREVAT